MYRFYFVVGGGRDVICDVELCNVCFDDLMLISDLDVDVVLRNFCAFQKNSLKFGIPIAIWWYDYNQIPT